MKFVVIFEKADTYQQLTVLVCEKFVNHCSVFRSMMYFWAQASRIFFTNHTF